MASFVEEHRSVDAALSPLRSGRDCGGPHARSWAPLLGGGWVRVEEVVVEVRATSTDAGP
jgi:hypothetical protein